MGVEGVFRNPPLSEHWTVLMFTASWLNHCARRALDGQPWRGEHVLGAHSGLAFFSNNNGEPEGCSVCLQVSDGRMGRSMEIFVEEKNRVNKKKKKRKESKYIYKTFISICLCKIAKSSHVNQLNIAFERSAFCSSLVHFVISSRIKGMTTLPKRDDGHRQPTQNLSNLWCASVKLFGIMWI